MIYTERREKDTIEEENFIPKRKRNKCCIGILIAIGIIILITTAVLIAIFCRGRKDKGNKNNNTNGSGNQIGGGDTGDNGGNNNGGNGNNNNGGNGNNGNGDNGGKDNDEKDINKLVEEDKPLEKEFEILTEIGLRKFRVRQNSLEENKIEGNLFRTNVTRITDYHLYTMKEEKANNQTKKYYNSTFLGAVAISAECYDSEGEGCIPHTLVDLSPEGQSRRRRRNIRMLTDSEELKKIPVALCLFNITDNNFILSMTCPEAFPATKRNEIILDLYFFKPPAIRRADKEKDGIKILIEDDNKNNRRHIRETNNGTCNVENNLGTICITDMNTTTDLKGKVITYDELAITNITNDENNSYVKTKTSNLVDMTEETENLDQDKYKENLDKLLSMIKPYMKEEIHFTTKNFQELYSLVQAKKKNEEVYIEEKSKNNFRNLLSTARQYVNEATLFHYEDVGGVKVFLNLKADSGIGDESQRTYSDLYFDKESNHLSEIVEYTKLGNVLDELIQLSKAGNHLATELYEKIKDKFEGITNDITLKINSLSDLLEYYELSEIFDATLSLDSIRQLPNSMISESKSLETKLNKLYQDIVTGNTKYYVDKLKDYVYEYNQNLQILVQKIFNNLRDLTTILSSEKNKLAEITTYYLNSSSESYEDKIKEVEVILNNYYKDGYDKIHIPIEEMFTEFEENYIETLRSPQKLIDNFLTKLENKSYTINYATDEDFSNMISYLYNSKKITNDIIDRIKEYINKEIGLKDNGYFISANEIEKNKNSFTPVLTESKEQAKKLDKDQYIDKTFDNIMIDFEDNITDIIKDMERKKEEQFVLHEDPLQYSIFDDDSKQNLQSQMNTIKTDIQLLIKEENNYYMNNIKSNITKFKDKESANLNNLISEINVLLSTDKLIKIAQNFEQTLTAILDEISKAILTNEKYANQYFDEYIKVLNDNNYLNNLINQRYQIASSIYSGKTRKFIRVDYQTIYSKEKTNAYITKYNTYKANFEYSKKYINESLFLDIMNEYKDVISKIKKELQSIRNLKIPEKYSDIPELDFFYNNLRTVDKLFTRLDDYISDNIFNNKHLKEINAFKPSKIAHLNSLESSINTKHNTINKLNLYGDNSNDICISFRRKVCYGCTNCAWYTYLDERMCFPLANTKTHINLIKTDAISNKDLISFKKEFETLYKQLSEKTKSYNSKWVNLENKFEQIKKETLAQKYTLNYLVPLDNYVNNVMEEKIGDNLVKASYDFYKKLVNEKIPNIFDESLNRFNSTINNLIELIDFNFQSFTNSISEYRVMVAILNSIFTQNSTRDFFNIIIDFEKTEFNSTISYYYSYIKKIINEAYQYIKGEIPTNEKHFNDIINLRIKDVDDIFKKILSNLAESKNTALSLEKQQTLLNVPETNFFKANSIMTDHIYNIKSLFDQKTKELAKFRKYDIDETALVSRYFLEIQQNWKRTTSFYKEVDHDVFVVLNLEKFEQIVFQNWIFDQTDFIKKLNIVLLDSTKEIRSEYLLQKDSYINQLEKEIDDQFPDETPEMKIVNFFSNEIKDLTQTQMENIKNNIQTIVNTIKEKIESESNILATTSTSYNSNYSKIESTLAYYKSKIASDLDTSLESIINGLYNNINQKYYTGCIVEHLDEYYTSTKKETSKGDYNEYKLYNLSYKIGEIILNSTEEIVKSYKTNIKGVMDQKYSEIKNKIKSDINYNDIINSVNNQIDSAYMSSLKESLKKYASKDPTDGAYPQYDFSVTIKEDIDSSILTNFKNIKSEMEKTKGNNYLINNNCLLDFSLSGVNLIKKICENFKDFLKAEKTAQKAKLDTFIKGVISSNYKDLLENIIPTFGTEFFDRIINYNEYFRINSLYDNLKFSLIQSLFYYKYIYATSTDVLPRELKTRIYNLNNLDTIVREKNENILKLLNTKITEFITKSKIDIMNRYLSYLQEDVHIKNSFDKTVLDCIDDNLSEMQPDLGKNYLKMVESFFKEKLLNSYTNYMNKKTDEMVKAIIKEKEILIAQIDDLFSFDTNQVLNEIQQKLNDTKDAMQAYKDHLVSFILSNDIKKYFNEFALNKVVPLLAAFQVEINKATKDKIILNIEKNSANITKLNSSKFITESKKDSEYFKNDYFSSINSSIESYGTTDYENNLDREINNKQLSLRRRLSGEETEEDIEKNTKERINDRSIEETFENILNKSTTAKNYFDGLDAINNLEKKINNYIKKLDYAIKKANDTIVSNQYDEDVEKFLNDKLQNLTNISQEYYFSINDSFYNLKNGLNQSLIYMHNLLSQCADTTYKTFNKKYQQISEKTEKVNKKYSNNSKIFNQIDYFRNTEHSRRDGIAKIPTFIEYSEFKFDYEFEGDKLKKPKIKFRIVDGSHPDTMNFNITSKFGTCGEIVNEINVKFNGANYTMDIDYSSDFSSNINITTFTNFDKYIYSTKVYQLSENNSTDSLDTGGIVLDYEDETFCNKRKKKDLKNEFNTVVDAVCYNETKVIEA